MASGWAVSRWRWRAPEAQRARKAAASRTRPGEPGPGSGPPGASHHRLPPPGAQPSDVLAQMGDFVRQMHERSGLLAEIGTVGVPLDEAGRRVLEYIKGHVPEPRTVPLCGNSIGMDRRFLARYLPEIEE